MRNIKENLEERGRDEWGWYKFEKWKVAETSTLDFSNFHFGQPICIGEILA